MWVTKKSPIRGRCIVPRSTLVHAFLHLYFRPQVRWTEQARSTSIISMEYTLLSVRLLSRFGNRTGTGLVKESIGHSACGMIWIATAIWKSDVCSKTLTRILHWTAPPCGQQLSAAHGTRSVLAKQATPIELGVALTSVEVPDFTHFLSLKINLDGRRFSFLISFRLFGVSFFFVVYNHLFAIFPGQRLFYFSEQFIRLSTAPYISKRVIGRRCERLATGMGCCFHHAGSDLFHFFVPRRAIIALARRSDNA